MNDESMTDTELADIERRADIADLIDYVCDDATMQDLRRLLDEVKRLKVENDDMRKRVAFAAAVISGDASEMLAESLAKSRSECAALAAKVEAAEALGERVEGALGHIRECLHIGLQDAKLYDEAGTKRIGEWADFIDKQIRAALDASGMPHAPTQEDSDV